MNIAAKSTFVLHRRHLLGIEGLSADEIQKAAATELSPLALDRAWEYFCQRAGVDPV